jgi:PAP2 superfamily
VREIALTRTPSTVKSSSGITESETAPYAADVTRLEWRAFTAGPGPWLRSCRHVMATHSWFIVAALLYLLIGYTVGALYDQRINIGMYSGVHLILYGNFLLAVIIWRTGWRLYRHRPAHPFHFIWMDLTREFITPWRIFNSLPALILLPLVISVATSMKRMIPLISPFSWDPTLAEFDRLLHGGNQPWELLQPFLGYPVVTYALSVAYSLPWFTLIIMMQFWLTFSLSPRRMRFLLTYLLCPTLLGTGLAIVFSSAGPIYYGRVVEGPDPFTPLLAYLNEVGQAYDLPSAMAQAYLWAGYENGSLNIGAGISAMPSLHLSMAFLLVLVCWRLHWSVRLATVLYLIVLLTGSVHLGWHYAIDGYVGIAATGLIYLTVTRALAWREKHIKSAMSATSDKASVLIPTEEPQPLP